VPCHACTPPRTVPSPPSFGSTRADRAPPCLGPLPNLIQSSAACWWRIFVSNFNWTSKRTSPPLYSRDPSSLKSEPKVSNLWNKCVMQESV
jgi:hypothetical protein